MRYSAVQVVFQEVPNEISLAIHITGCPLRCPGCHSSDSWSQNIGKNLDQAELVELFEKYSTYVSCILYLGGEWEPIELETHLKLIKLLGYKTALYTGLDYEQVPSQILDQLDYLKYGRYDSVKGPLSSPSTNQQIINLNTKENLNHYFQQEGNYHDTSR